MSYTTLPTKQVKRTDFLGRIGRLFGVEQWKYQDVIIVSGTWTKEQHNALINASPKYGDGSRFPVKTLDPMEHLAEDGKWYLVGGDEAE